MIPANVKSEVLALIDGVCNGTIDAAGMAALEDALSGDVEAQDFYIEYCQLHIEIGFAQGVDRAVAETLRSKAEASKETAQQATASPVLGFLADSAKMAQDTIAAPTPFSLIVAAGVVSLVLVMMALIYLPNDANQLASRRPDEATAQPLARAASVKSATDCVWRPGAAVRITGQRLHEGEMIELEEGRIHLDFGDGTQVVLHGPAHFRTDSKAGGTLFSGRLAARAADGASGFVVETPAARMLDLGTEFGVVVDQSKTSILRVYQGRVEVGPKDADGKVDRRRHRVVRSGQEIRIAMAGRIENIRPGTVAFEPIMRRVGSTIIYRGELDKFRGAKDINLSGEIVWAMNVGGDRDVTVHGVRFLSDRAAQRAGAVIRSDRRFPAWHAKPRYGETADDDALEAIMHSARHGSSDHKPDAVEVSLPLKLGVYRVQLLISDNLYGGFSESKPGRARKEFDIRVEGEEVVRRLMFPERQGSWDAAGGEAPTCGVVYSMVVSVVDGRLDIVLPRGGSNDKSIDKQRVSLTPTLNGLIVTRTD